MIKQMGIAITKWFDAWSWSRLVDWESCALNAYLTHLAKLGKFENDAMIRGRDVHARAGLYLQGKARALPAECGQFKAEMARLKKFKPIVEEDARFAFNDRWGKTGWFDKDAWLRVVFDAAAMVRPKVLLLVDHKTGRYRTEEVVKYGQQMKLYAPAGFALYPQADEVDVRIWFHDAGREESESYYRRDEKMLRHYWETRAARMLSDRKFAPTPSKAACVYCRHGVSKGGPCRAEVR